MSKYSSENEIESVVISFENGTISRADWRHAEHLTVALHYLSHYEFDEALVKMREGILNLLRAFEIDLSKDTPYHETLTIFWLKSADDFRSAKKNSSLLEICNEAIEKFDKDYPLNFYSREFLFSDKARKNFVEADLQTDLTTF